MADADHPHVVLVGLSGTGKTSIGRLVAQRLEMPFVDTDDAIEERTGRTVREVFAEDGEPRFREVEAAVIAEVLVGGGADGRRRGRRRGRDARDAAALERTRRRSACGSRPSPHSWRHAPRARCTGRCSTAIRVGALTRLSEERQPWFEQVADAIVSVQPALSTEPKPQAKARLADLIADMVTMRRQQRTLDHVVLVGPMGSGKSTVGKIIAHRLDRPYVDSDDEVERRTGRTAREIAASDGLPALHRLELTILRDAMASDAPSVIGSAASVVDGSLGRLVLTRARQVVWLHADAQHLAQRRAASGSDHRPAIDPGSAQRREPLYRSVATTVVDVDDLAPEVVADKALS